jgi:hypothetical protein
MIDAFKTNGSSPPLRAASSVEGQFEEVNGGACTGT